MINYGAAIKRIRLELGIKQTDIAEKTGISTSYLSLVENGKAVPSLSVLKQVAEAMKIPYEIIAWEAIDPPDNLKQEQRQVFLLAKAIIKDYLQSLKKKPVKVK